MPDFQDYFRTVSCKFTWTRLTDDVMLSFQHCSLDWFRVEHFCCDLQGSYTPEVSFVASTDGGMLVIGMEDVGPALTKKDIIAGEIQKQVRTCLEMVHQASLLQRDIQCRHFRKHPGGGIQLLDFTVRVGATCKSLSEKRKSWKTCCLFDSIHWILTSCVES